ncbi:TPA: hypothetical protein JD053_26790 [Klebsiella michiganensis]|jgi:predicted transcriptional regulator|uniref:Uncharacterized protein n=1 Tax=Klebsiella michiganensis TaxID=1134687 RepID=A0A0J2L5X2_9ENTR|nr:MULTISPECIES: hypothetical protein [Klebsiella]ARB19911.1 hypothetical protein AM394_00935 [Klebsiella oxytoca]AUW10190.1 hypothetical protein C2U42_13520 [Klebsiella oxytoca]EKV5142191.1 hypothetical protein [Klebsiella michiganensis]EWF70870.1 hypothetical protein L387_02217 [Klebsiella michiganensis]KLY40488.1 hypothetical protein SK91_01686 [Klebsiella michiganensis]
MSVTYEESMEHMETFGLTRLETMHIAEYQKALEEEGFFWDYQHGVVMHTLSGERVVTNTEQLDALLKHLESYRNNLSDPSI